MKSNKISRMFVRVVVFTALNLLFVFGPTIVNSNVYATPLTSADSAVNALYANPAATYSVAVVVQK